MELKQVTEGVWEASYELKLGLVPLVSRMTVVRLAHGGLWVHSPGPVTAAVAAQLQALGSIAAVVAPNQFHHLYVQDFGDRVGHAPLYAAPGLAAKRPDLTIAETLSEQVPQDWQDDFELLHLAGMPKFEEVIFLHKPSQTLIVTDLVFNLGTEMPLRTQLATRIFGTYGRFATSRLFRLLIKDKTAFRRSLEQLADWQYDRIVMAHGAVLETNAKANVNRVLAEV